MLTVARRFSCSARNAKQISVGYKNIEVVKNIQDREHEAFWKSVGPIKSGLKETDLKKFKESLGEDFSQTLTFLKNTDRLVASNSHTIYRPLNGQEITENLVFMGHSWISPDVKQHKIGNIAARQSYDAGFSVGNDSMGYATRKTMNWYKKTTGSVDSLHRNYVSHYDFGDLQIPKKLESEGIVVKNARDVADQDILNYDAKIFKYERSKYVLRQLREDFGRVAYDSNGDVIGFGAVSVGHNGECSITPMYADNINVARNILKSILEEMTLDSEKYWRLQVRSHDSMPESYGWIRPFVRTMTHRTEVSTLMCDHKQFGMDFSKVYSTFHPIISPM